MTTDEAREAAWREHWLNHKPAPYEENAKKHHGAGWDARGQHDKEQIAALVDEHEHGLWQFDYSCYRCRANQERVFDFLRALAGQSEEATG